MNSKACSFFMPYKFIKIISLNLLSIALLIFFFELLVRVLMPEIQLPMTDRTLFEENRYYDSFGLKPGSNGKINGVQRTVNHAGFWQFKSPINPGKNSWLFLGDSVTMGLGVEDDSTFAGLINDEIDSINILNSAMIGYYTKDYLNACNRLFNSKDFKITKATVFWCLNDIYGNFPTPNLRGQWFRDRSGVVLKFTRENFKFYHFLKNLFFDRSQAYYQYDADFYTENNEFLNQAIENIKQIAQIASEKNIQFKLFILPYEFQIRNYDQKNIFKPQKILLQRLNLLDVTVYDCTQVFMEFANESKTLYLYGDGIHLSKKGHRKIAEFVVQMNGSSITNNKTNPGFESTQLNKLR